MSEEENIDEEDLKGKEIMGGWDLISFGPNGMELSLDFTDPLEVSAGDTPDLLFVQLDLSDYKDADGQSLPESLVKYIPIVNQMKSKEQAEQVKEQGTTANESAKNSIISNVLINVMLSGSLNKVWDMIEGLQIAYHLPFFKVKSPGNVNAFNSFFAEIGGF